MADENETLESTEGSGPAARVTRRTGAARKGSRATGSTRRRSGTRAAQVKKNGPGSLKIAYVAAEFVPLVKVGGLGDVSGALPEVLARMGHRVMVLLPHYRDLKLPASAQLGTPRSVPVLMHGGVETAILTPVTWGGLDCEVVLIGGGTYFDRPGIYNDPATGRDFSDNARRFVFFQRAVLEGLKALEFRPDVLHLNDFQCGLIPAYLKLYYADDAHFKTCATLFSIHNLGYQGVYGPEMVREAGIPERLFYPASPFEFWGGFNFMKAGIMYADLITTVSERYAQEISTSKDYGFGLEGVLGSLGSRLRGILNGIDTAAWSPQTDRHLSQAFGPQNLHLKRRNKEALLAEVGLPRERADMPLVGIISRLVEQKGFDLLEQVGRELLQEDLSLVVLGSGAERFHRLFEGLRAEFPHKVAFLTGFQEPLAHRIEGGADLFLMPSRYEPCGLNQMYSMRYGTVPVVRATGGLADTVRNYDPVRRMGTGFSFEEYSGTALLDAVRRALETWKDRDAWRVLMLACMSQDFSWEASARKYVEAYEFALDTRRRQALATWLTVGQKALEV